MKRLLMAAALWAVLTASAMADFTTTNAGPIISAGPLGNAGNGVFNSVNTGASSLYGSMVFSGALTELNTGTFASEARWNLRNTTSFGGTNSFSFQSSTTGNFTGTINIGPFTQNGLFWINNNDNFRFEAFESFDDSGNDASWANTSFNFTNTVSTVSIGSFVQGTSFSFDTETSTMSDTELAGYFSDGTFIATDDDSGTGLLSLLNLGTLAAGNYNLVLGGFNSTFTSGFATAGTNAGGFNIRLNGVTVDSGTLASGQFRVLSFTVNAVPEPSSLALLSGLGLLGMAVRFRRR